MLRFAHLEGGSAPMAGFIPLVTAAIPLVKDIADSIKKKVETSTAAASTKAQADAAKVDKNKGPAVAKAAATGVSDAAKSSVGEAAKTLSADYKKAQLALSEQLDILAALRPFFDAEDHLFAMKQVLTFKGQKLDPKDV